MTHIIDPGLFEAEAIKRNRANEKVRRMLTPEQFEVFVHRRTGKTFRKRLAAQKGTEEVTSDE